MMIVTVIILIIITVCIIIFTNIYSWQLKMIVINIIITINVVEIKNGLIIIYSNYNHFYDNNIYYSHFLLSIIYIKLYIYSTNIKQ